MPNIVRKRSMPSPVMLAFATALAATPIVSPAADTSSTSARAGDGTALAPSAAALKHIKALSLTMARTGPRWIELWPEVTHVEAVRP